MQELCVVLVEPKYSGNVGSVARCMKNFGVKTLYLVNPCPLDDIAYMMAVHARDILENAKIFDNFDNAIENVDISIATTSVIEEHRKACLRKAFTLKELSEEIRDFNGRIGLFFGREDYGLYNEEIKKCDMVATIPTADEYPSLNISHAVCICLYEMFSSGFDRRVMDKNIGYKEKEKMMEFFLRLLNEIDYPEHKREKAEITFRRVLGKAKLTELEYHTLIGILREAVERLESK